MKHLTYLVILALSFTWLQGCKQAKKLNEATTGPSINVMAYYVPEKNYQPEKLPLDQLTHIIFSFTNVIDGEMKFRDSINEDRLRALVSQRKMHPNLKIMIACGGWGAKGFSNMAVSSESRQKFVKSVIAFNKKYKP